MNDRERRWYRRQRAIASARARAMTDRGYCCEVLSRGARARGAMITWFLAGDVA